jgi:hypothetical protein
VRWARRARVGGIVLYVSETNLTSTGSNCSTTCKYLEAAPAPGGGDVLRSWATGDNDIITVPAPGATAQGIDSGMANTNAIQAQVGNVAASSAAVYAFDYTNNGKTDWHLPSLDELNQLYSSRGVVGVCTAPGIYWSSSELDEWRAWYQIFDGGSPDYAAKNNPLCVRPVRAFG